MKINNKFWGSFIKLVLLLTLSQYGFSQNNYDVGNIKEELKKGANVVIRNHLQEFEIISRSKAIIKETLAVTILNKKGDDYATYYDYYDKHKKINFIKGTLYDAKGKYIGKLKKSEIKDRSAVSNVSLFDDNRIKIAKLASFSYPFTVVFESEVSNENLMFYPQWQPQDDEFVAVENSKFVMKVFKNDKLRYKTFNAKEPEIGTDATGKDTYTWKVKNLNPVKYEPYSPRWNEFVPTVYTAPNQIEVDGYKGNLSSWKSLGHFQNTLNINRNDLPQEAKDEIKSIVSSIPDKKGKIKAVYNYLQENTRYVSIQLGIGGWQPFKASFVHEKKYGDCKALTNYTKAMLDEIGIESYYTLVYAGKYPRKLYNDFPVMNFNHVFLSVPMEKDTVWLECTSQTNPFGYLSDFTSDRDVLLIKPDGGELVRTPAYEKHENLMIQNANVKIDESGNATANIRIDLTAIQQNKAAYYSTQSPKKQKDWLYEFIDIATFEIESYKFNYSKDVIPKVSIDVKVNIRKCASLSGKRLFLKPNLLSQWKKSPKKIEDRKTDLVLNSCFVDTDTITYELPANFHKEALPKSNSFETEFGKYESKIQLEGNKLIYTRHLEINKGRFSSEKYNDYVDFRKKIAKADKSKAVFINKT